MEPTSEEISILADKLSALAKQVAGDTDPKTRSMHSKALIMEAKKVVWQLQSPADAVTEHVVNSFTLGAVKALLSIGVFEAIPPTGSATAKEIAEKCGADQALIIRLMRQPVCVNIFTEVKACEWAHNRLSIGLSKHFGVAGRYLFEVSQSEMAPAIVNLDRYMEVHGKSDILTYTDTPHSWVHNMSGKTFWEVLGSDKARIDTFSRGLASFDGSYPVVAIFPYEQILQEGSSLTRPSIVDIGGGHGQALREFVKNCSSIQGELVLQDRQEVLDGISREDLPSVTKMAHDFFTEQPVKNAQIYYIRRVLHDWQDTEAAQILNSIKPAMGPDSRIIVSDVALPEPITTNDADAVWMDLMMLAIGGKERTAREWRKLAELSGLKLVKIWQEPARFGPVAVMEYTLPDEHSMANGSNGANT